jgi:hypothetical protein
LTGRIGKEALQWWAKLEDELTVEREIIRTVADIKFVAGRQGKPRAVWPAPAGLALEVGPHSDTEAA